MQCRPGSACAPQMADREIRGNQPPLLRAHRRGLGFGSETSIKLLQTDDLMDLVWLTHTYNTVRRSHKSDNPVRMF